VSAEGVAIANVQDIVVDIVEDIVVEIEIVIVIVIVIEIEMKLLLLKSFAVIGCRQNHVSMKIIVDFRTI